MQQYDFSIVQGDTFSATWNYGSSITGATARMKLKRKFDGAEAIELTTENGGITITGSNIALAISATDSADIEYGIYRYDIKVIISGVTTTFRQGYVNVIPQVSNA
jgi:hypothetical protein